MHRLSLETGYTRSNRIGLLGNYQQRYKNTVVRPHEQDARTMTPAAGRTTTPCTADNKAISSEGKTNRAEQSRAAQSRAAQSRAAQSRAEQNMHLVLGSFIATDFPPSWRCMNDKASFEMPTTPTIFLEKDVDKRGSNHARNQTRTRHKFKHAEAAHGTVQSESIAPRTCLGRLGSCAAFAQA